MSRVVSFILIQEEPEEPANNKLEKHPTLRSSSLTQKEEGLNQGASRACVHACRNSYAVISWWW